MRKQFRDTVSDLAARDDRLVVILGDISHFLFVPFQERYPTRFYNMGICENALISVAAGLHCSRAFTPSCIPSRRSSQSGAWSRSSSTSATTNSAATSSPLARPLTTPGTATHHAYTDLAILRLIPGMEVIQPGTNKELDALIRSQYANGRPTYFRLSDHPHEIDLPVEFGKGAVLKDSGAEVTVMTAGPILGNVLEACREAASQPGLLSYDQADRQGVRCPFSPHEDPCGSRCFRPARGN